MNDSVKAGSLYADLPQDLTAEHFCDVLTRDTVRIKRIVSPPGHADPPGAWYDQEEAEWVLVLAGEAGLRLAGEPAPRVLKRGDYLQIPAHVRHRVEWTHPQRPTIWLAVYHPAARK